MIKTIYGNASWHYMNPTTIQLWTSSGTTWHIVAETCKVTGRIIVQDPMSQQRKIAAWNESMRDADAKTRAVEMLVELGIVDPVDFIAATMKST